MGSFTFHPRRNPPPYMHMHIHMHMHMHMHIHICACACKVLYLPKTEGRGWISDTPCTSAICISAITVNIMTCIHAYRDAATATQGLTRFDKISPQFAVVSRYSPLPHPRLPPHRPLILRHNFSRVRVPDMLAAAVPPQITSDPPTSTYHPPQYPPASPDQYSPAGHLDISESCVLRAVPNVSYWHLSSKKTSGPREQS